MNIDSDQCRQLSVLNGLVENFPRNQAIATLILAHGAGAPMDSPFMEAMVERLVSRDIAVLRFEFPYMAARRQDGMKRPPNQQAVLLECWRQVYAQAREVCSGLLAVGGKSMGGRMASLLADELEADALICLGYPFYAAGKPDKPRVAHLAELRTPTLIIQGERDPMGNQQSVRDYDFSSSIEVHWLPAADHDLKPLKSSGFSHDQHLETAAAAVAAFLTGIVAGR